jgi:hypothetical protein
MGAGFIALLPLGCITIPYIRSFMEKDYENGSIKNRHRYTYRDIVSTMLACGWYFVISVFPWIYLWRGPFECATDTACADMKFHISPLLVYSLPVCCAVAGFRFARAISVSACDVACEREMQSLTDDPRYGPALFDIINKLSDMTDKLSFFSDFRFWGECRTRGFTDFHENACDLVLYR